jgi:ubiquinone/menaquinone biosynthesis C-methylase UbiE
MVELNPTCLLCSSARLTAEWSLAASQIFDQLSHEWGLDDPKGPAVNLLRETKKLTHFLCLDCGVGFWFPLIPGDSDFYESISSTYVDVRWDKKVVQKYIRKSASILDVGAGPDPIFSKLKSLQEIHAVTLDINPFANAQTSSQFEQYSDFNELVKSNINFHDITALHFLEHIENPVEYFREIVKILAPGGSIWISVPNRERGERHLPFDSLDVPPHHMTSWNLKALQNFALLLDLLVVNAWVSKPRSSLRLVRGIHHLFWIKEYSRIIYHNIHFNRRKKLLGYQLLVQLRRGK